MIWIDFEIDLNTIPLYTCGLVPKDMANRGHEVKSWFTLVVFISAVRYVHEVEFLIRDILMNV